MDALVHIKGAKLVTDVYGRWPTFHDAEVLRIVLDRGTSVDGPTLAMDIRTFEMTNETDAKGYIILRNEKVVSFRFVSVTDLELGDFNHQNVLFDLKIHCVGEEGSDTHFDVSLHPSHGVSALFRCREAVVQTICDFRPDSRE